jgi:hypothetical protein
MKPLHAPIAHCAFEMQLHASHPARGLRAQAPAAGAVRQFSGARQTGPWRGGLARGARQLPCARPLPGTAAPPTVARVASVKAPVEAGDRAVDPSVAQVGASHPRYRQRGLWRGSFG